MRECLAVGDAGATDGDVVACLANSSHMCTFIDDDMGAWLEVLSLRPESQLYSVAVVELRNGLHMLEKNFRRQSFFSLRFFLEHMLAGIMFSVDLYGFNLWKVAQKDVSWAMIVDDNAGVFSKRFADAFFEELRDEVVHINSIAKSVYRKCSEFVHGNNSVCGVMGSDGGIFARYWEGIFNECRYVVTFALALRYLKDMDAVCFSKVENVVVEELGTIAEVRSFYSYK